MWLRSWLIALALGAGVALCARAEAAEMTRYRSEHMVVVAIGGLSAETFHTVAETTRLRETVAQVGARAEVMAVPAQVDGLAALLPAGQRAGQGLAIVSRGCLAGPQHSPSWFRVAKSNLAAFHTFSQALFSQRPQACLLALSANGEREVAEVDLLISYLWLRLQSEAPLKGKTTLALLATPPTESPTEGLGLLFLLGPDVRPRARPSEALDWADLQQLAGAMLTGAAVESRVAAALVEPPTPVAPPPKPKPAAKPPKRRPRVRRSIDLDLSGYVASEATYGSGRLALKRDSDRSSVTLRGTVSKTITRIEGVSLSERPSTVRRILEARGEWLQPPSDHYSYLGVSASERKRERERAVIGREAYHFVVAGLGRPISRGWKADLGVGWFKTRNEQEQEGWGPALGWQVKKQLSSRLSLTGSAVVIQPVESPRGTRFQSDLTVSRPLTERLSLRLGLLLDNFTRPLRVREDWSYQARVSLGYRYRN
ncbi:hypothetical protein AMK68_02975 [candidate division KD3-62 bacterium DG_56]|uniref:DUF481 domain-containing protein n=1 Tax=candidate division KD3-62 bacterium DG_56 TaxID=1704032 RepID=A0A0S7XMZ0_9BACT|nr:MAG: hypothetical protein AMK68_02975 [candidate division KD3-62 bacterium DG_56]